MNDHPPSCFCSECREGGDEEKEPQFNTFTLCKEIKERISDLTMFVKETADYMLPNTDNESQPKRSGGRRRNSGDGSGRQYIENSHLSHEKKTEFKIVALKLEDGQYGASLVLKLLGVGRTLYWRVNIKKNPNYNLLLEQFGRNESEWINQVIWMYLAKDDFDDVYWPRASFDDGPIMESNTGQKVRRK